MMKLSKFTIFFSIYIVISSLFMQQVWTKGKALFGIQLVSLFFILICMATILVIIYINIKYGFNLKKLVVICIICIFGFIFAWRQPYFPEKAHVLEFALLGWITTRDLTKQGRYFLKNVVLAFIFIIIIGYLEEGFQWFLPWRRFELRDVITDTLSGMLGIILYVISYYRQKCLLS